MIHVRRVAAASILMMLLLSQHPATAQDSEEHQPDVKSNQSESGGDPLQLTAAEIVEQYPAEIDYLTSTHKLNEPEAANAIRQTVLAPDLRSWAMAGLGSAYAGVWIDYDSLSVNIGVAGDPKAFQPAIDAVTAEQPALEDAVHLVPMPRSYDSLTAAAAKLDQALQALTAAPVIVRYHEDTSELTVDGIKDPKIQTETEVQAVLASPGFPKVNWNNTEVQAPVNTGGGWHWINNCTMAFTVVSPANQRGVLTAGHCGDGSTTHNGVQLGTPIHQRSWWCDDANDPCNEPIHAWDRQIHPVLSGADTTTAVLEQPNVTIGGTVLPAQGSLICRYGGASVAQGQAITFCTNVNGFDTQGLIGMTTGCIHGDSGGPAWMINKAVGIAAATSDGFWPVDQSSTCFEAAIKDQLSGTPYFVQDTQSGTGSDFSQIGLYHAVAPSRVYSGSNVSGTVQVALGNISYADLGAAVLSVTAVSRGNPGIVRVEPGNNNFIPPTSDVNFPAGGVGSNLVVSRVDVTTHTVSIFASTSVDLYVDTIGYFSRANGQTGLPGGSAAYPVPTPSRVYDSRSSGGALAHGLSRDIQITGVAPGVPSNATAVVANVTATQPTAAGWLAYHRGGSAWPGTSNLNYLAGETRARLGVVQLDSAGRIRITAGGLAGSTHFIVDILGYLIPPATTNPDGRTLATDGAGGRVLDTRSGAALGPGAVRCLDMYSFRQEQAAGTPRERVRGFWLNVTATSNVGAGHLVVRTSGQSVNTSNLNYGPGAVTESNMVFVAPPSNTNGSICIQNVAGTTDVIVDASGFTLS